MTEAASILPDDIAELKAMVLSMQASLRAHEVLIQSLRIQIARLKKQKFGASSEKVEREIEQLELALEGLEIARAEQDLTTEDRGDGDDTDIATEAKDETPAKRRRKPRVSDDTLRERIVLDPGEDCPHCAGPLRLIGEDVSEILEFISAKLKLVETARLKKTCRRCEKITQMPAPSRPVPRGMAGPGLLAYILVSKYDDHLPLYRQGEIFARMGADIPSSTLVDWCGQGVRALSRLVERIREEIMASDRLHADDTPVKVLTPSRRAKGLGKGVKEGRIWTYVRDDRPWAGTAAPPGVAYYFSADRKGEHPQKHLAAFKGILQADAYAGFKALYAPDKEGNIKVREAACWAHLRRDFHDAWKATGSVIAKEAIDRIGEVYDIEREITGKSSENRLAVRQKQSKPKVVAFKAWAEDQLGKISGKGDLAKAFRYALKRWPSFALFLDDGHVAIDNNVAERAIKPVVIGRKNWMFAGRDAGGETLAAAMTIIETAKMNGLNPQAYLADILGRIQEHKVNRLDELLPWNWSPLKAPKTAAAKAERAA